MNNLVEGKKWNTALLLKPAQTAISAELPTRCIGTEKYWLVRYMVKLLTVIAWLSTADSEAGSYWGKCQHKNRPFKKMKAKEKHGKN
jgi:hypothetical protein